MIRIQLQIQLKPRECMTTEITFRISTAYIKMYVLIPIISDTSSIASMTFNINSFIIRKFPNSLTEFRRLETMRRYNPQPMMEFIQSNDYYCFYRHQAGILLLRNNVSILKARHAASLRFNYFVTLLFMLFPFLLQ